MSVLSDVLKFPTLAACLLGAGCANYQAHDNLPASQESFQSDLARCREYAVPNTHGNGPIEGLIYGALIGAAHGATIGGHGLSGEVALIGTAAGASIGFVLGLGEYAFEYNRSVNQCMGQHGYS